MTQAYKKRIIKRLAQFKQDYNFTSKDIAQALETTEAAVSHWFNGDSLPRAEKVEKVKQLFDKYCIPGIIKIPKNKYWSNVYFLQVDDIKNPYMSYCEDKVSGKYPQDFAQWVKDWAKMFPNPELFRTYMPNDAGRAVCHLDYLNLNTTIEHQDYFIGQGSFEQAVATYHIYCTYEYDYALASAIAAGEWND